MAGRHVWAQIEDGIVTVGVTAPLGEVLWYTPDVEFWAVDRVDVGETLATVQGRWVYRFNDQDQVVSARVERA